MVITHLGMLETGGSAAYCLPPKAGRLVSRREAQVRARREVSASTTQISQIRLAMKPFADEQPSLVLLVSRLPGVRLALVPLGAGAARRG